MFLAQVAAYEIENAHTLTAVRSVNLYQELTDTSEHLQWLIGYPWVFTVFYVDLQYIDVGVSTLFHKLIEKLELLVPIVLTGWTQCSRGVINRG